MNTIKIKHPTLSGVGREVPEKDVESWLAAGWVRVKPRRLRPGSGPTQEGSE